MSTQLTVEEVKAIVASAKLKKQYRITVTPEAYGACCVEVRDTEYGNLAWRKRSFEPDFEADLSHFLRLHS